MTIGTALNLILLWQVIVLIAVAALLLLFCARRARFGKPWRVAAGFKQAGNST